MTSSFAPSSEPTAMLDALSKENEFTIMGINEMLAKCYLDDDCKTILHPGTIRMLRRNAVSNIFEHLNAYTIQQINDSTVFHQYCNLKSTQSDNEL
ncbi:unnamed protein product [Thelazia callipaeda]|uniref:Late expression factor 11 n=1 Tax=Thelazia callipaeda TaxID=103827 RepID=A0A0N5D344_THECL|nr:unnamed protein product [Thelazia callipaeda]